jgi:hypothetical protein
VRCPLLIVARCFACLRRPLSLDVCRVERGVIRITISRLTSATVRHEGSADTLDTASRSAVVSAIHGGRIASCFPDACFDACFKLAAIDRFEQKDLSSSLKLKLILYRSPQYLLAYFHSLCLSLSFSLTLSHRSFSFSLSHFTRMRLLASSYTSPHQFHLLQLFSSSAMRQHHRPACARLAGGVRDLELTRVNENGRA